MIVIVGGMIIDSVSFVHNLFCLTYIIFEDVDNCNRFCSIIHFLATEYVRKKKKTLHIQLNFRTDRFGQTVQSR